MREAEADRRTAASSIGCSLGWVVVGSAIMTRTNRERDWTSRVNLLRETERVRFCLWPDANKPVGAVLAFP